MNVDGWRPPSSAPASQWRKKEECHAARLYVRRSCDGCGLRDYRTDLRFRRPDLPCQVCLAVSLDEIDVERTCLCTRTIGSQKSDNAGSGLSDRLGGQRYDHLLWQREAGVGHPSRIHDPRGRRGHYPMARTSRTQLMQCAGVDAMSRREDGTFKSTAVRRRVLRQQVTSSAGAIWPSANGNLNKEWFVYDRDQQSPTCQGKRSSRGPIAPLDSRAAMGQDTGSLRLYRSHTLEKFTTVPLTSGTFNHQAPQTSYASSKERS